MDVMRVQKYRILLVFGKYTFWYIGENAGVDICPNSDPILHEVQEVDETLNRVRIRASGITCVPDSSGGRYEEKRRDFLDLPELCLRGPWCIRDIPQMRSDILEAIIRISIDVISSFWATGKRLGNGRVLPAFE